MKAKFTTLRQIDKKVSGFKSLLKSMPRNGWIKNIRSALGITLNQQAKNLGVSKTRVVDIENGEEAGSLTLKTMENVADSLNCKFVYCFVPKDSFEQTVRNRAKALATEYVKRTQHTMALEDQATASNLLEEQIQEMAEELLRGNWKNLWEEDDIV